MTSCSQVDGCLLFEDKTLVTVMKIQGVTTEVTVSSTVRRHFGVFVFASCLDGQSETLGYPAKHGRTYVRLLNVY
jgi:hypothetical protein